MQKNESIFVAGHKGLVGSAIVRDLKAQGFNNLLTAPRAEVDLLDQQAVRSYFKQNRISYVFLGAAKVGGIISNSRYQADFLYENLMVAANVIHAAAEHGVKKLLFLGSSCIYPKFAPQPIKEEYLLTGPLEPTNEGYAIAKIAGLKLCEKYYHQYDKLFISAMPTNLYGPNDNYHPENSHVIPGLLRRFHQAKVKGDKEVVIWGTGTPRREFLYVDDLAVALRLMMLEYSKPEFLNVGTGEDCTILSLAENIKEVVGFQGKITLDTSKPDGTPRKVLDVTKIKALGWNPRFTLREGLSLAYKSALENNKL